MLPTIVHNSGLLSTPSYEAVNRIGQQAVNKTGKVGRYRGVQVTGKKREEATLSGRIRIAMAAKGIGTPAALARKMKINRQTVHKWVTGQGDKLTPEMLFGLSDALDVNPRWLAFGPPESPTKPHSMDLEATEVVQLDKALRETDSASRDEWLRQGRNLVRLLTPATAGNPFSPRRK